VHPFTYERAGDLDAAIAALDREPQAAALAGGTELVNWLKEGIVRPRRVVDISRIPGLDGVEVSAGGLRLGALATLGQVAADPSVRAGYPAITEALLRSASQQLRNMATVGGNLLQRTRCPYFRAETELPCNKRQPGSGCAAMEGEDRGLAVFGWSGRCLATHPSDLAVALVALDAEVRLRGPRGERSLPVEQLLRLPGEEPERDTELGPGELVTDIAVPASAVARRSWYLKLRERASYEFALVSVAAALDLDAGGRVAEARVALGGVAHRPWRLRAAEDRLRGAHPGDGASVAAALEESLAEARPRRHNGFKIELARRAVVRVLGQLGEAGGR
jgi:xanthine dehydrogenase YagS FAD-binding subunit